MPTNKQTKKISVDPFKLFTNNLWSPGELKTIVAKVKQAQAKQKKKPKKLADDDASLDDLADDEEDVLPEDGYDDIDLF